MPVSLYTRFTAHLDAVLDALEAEGTLPAGLNRKPVTVEPPRDPAHGDLSTNYKVAPGDVITIPERVL